MGSLAHQKRPKTNKKPEVVMRILYRTKIPEVEVDTLACVPDACENRSRDAGGFVSIRVGWRRERLLLGVGLFRRARINGGYFGVDGGASCICMYTFACVFVWCFQLVTGTVWEQLGKELGGTEMKPGDDQHLLDTECATKCTVERDFVLCLRWHVFWGSREKTLVPLSTKMENLIRVSGALFSL